MKGHDLMIFSFNYGEVNPAKSPPDDMTSPILTWTRLNERTWSLQLDEPCPGLKGLHITASLPDGITPVVTDGSMLQNQAGPVFLRDNNRNGLEIDLAVMGYGIGFTGKGEIFQVQLPEAIDLIDISLEARNIYNKELEYELNINAEVQVPRAYRLAQNYPNPFNPSTKICFDLPEAQFVRLVIYSIEGRRVTDLVNEYMSPGKYDVIWNGQDNSGKGVASGTYFIRIDAGPFSQTRKMTLMK